MPDIWFTSDTHFGHEKILTLGAGRPFSSVEEMDETLVRNWNKRVRKDDLVFHLGDFAFADHQLYLQRLNGQKRLIRGNHDHSNRINKAKGWATVDDLLDFKIGEQKLVLCHYALRTWRASGKGSINLHGHSHGNLPGDSQQIDVGVDPWGFRPISFDEIKGALALNPSRSEPDHH